MLTSLMQSPTKRAAAWLAGQSALIYCMVLLPAVAAADTPLLRAERVFDGWVLATTGLAIVLITLSTIDALTFELPDALTWPLAAVGVAMSATTSWGVAAERLVMAVGAFALFSGLAHLYLMARGRDGLGRGDAKFFAAAAAWLGLEALPTVIAFASLAALATVAVASLRAGTISVSTRLPFGPYIALSFWIVWLYGPIVATGG